MAGFWNAPIGSNGRVDPVARGANWFFWIAGLSVANTVMYMFGAGVFMVMGLASAMVATVFFEGLGAALAGRGSVASIVMGVLSAVLFSGIFAGLGWFARKRMGWAFVVGMVLYTLDALIWLALGDFMSVLFHALALVFIFQGYRALVASRKVAVPGGATVGDAALAQARPVQAAASAVGPAVPVVPASQSAFAEPREATAPAAFDMRPPGM